jgi:hypothetical protein
LDVAEILSAVTPTSIGPKSWPPPAAIEAPQLAAAYRDYAYDRRESAVLFAEATLLAASAALGSTIPGILTGGWAAVPPGAALLTGLLAVMLRRRSEDKWTAVASLYDRRRERLRREPPLHPAATPLPVSLSRLAAWLSHLGAREHPPTTR